MALNHISKPTPRGDAWGVGTQDIETVECEIRGSRVTLVDTPGFDDSKRSDTEILSLIAARL